MSSHVRKPRPPKTISAAITVVSNGLPAYRVSETNFAPSVPSRSNPALQNAEME